MEQQKSKISTGKPSQDKKNKFSQTHEVDDAVFESLENIIEKYEKTRDLTELIAFFQKGYANQITQTWSYFAQVNNHAKFSKTTVQLSHALRILGSNTSTIEYGSTLISQILVSYVKVLYRGLNNLRVHITNPIIRLMEAIVLYNKSTHIEDFISYFDFSIGSLPKILTPGKSEMEGSKGVRKPSGKSMRTTFIEFWLSLISNTPALLRKDLLLDNVKIMGAWFKYMDKLDSSKLMMRTVTVFIESILNEGVFKRMTKTKVLNELALNKIHHYYYSSDKDLVKLVNEFFVAYGSNPSTSVAFPDNCVWFSESPLTGVNNAVTVIANQKEFKIYNKLLFNMLRIFKPWEDDLQLNTVIKILKQTPELVAPYCHYLASLGSYDPKMTSYWFGCTLLLGRIINLDIPDFVREIQTDMVPSTQLVIENIIPSSLTKISLTKAIQHEKLIIRQLASQNIVFAFQKLEKVLNMFDAKGWSSSKANISTAFLENIPELSVFTTALTSVYSSDKQNQIFPLSLTLILKFYSRCFPNFFSVTLPGSNVYVDIIQKDSFSGLDLAILDNFLQYQEFNGTQTKWWNSAGKENSLFTSLLKLASSKNSTNVVSFKINKLLEGILHGTVMFDEKLLASPILGLINSIQAIIMADIANDTLAKLWRLLDETISRCVKTPYKYVDLGKEYGNVSPFVMAILEQWKFVSGDGDNDLLYRWICIYLRSMIIIGEPLKVAEAGRKFLENVPSLYIDTYLNFNSSNNELTNDKVLTLSVGSSFFQFITSVPYGSIKTSSRVPISDFDSAGLLFRLKEIITDDKINYNNDFKVTISVLFDQLVGFYNLDNSSRFVSKEIYEQFFYILLKDYEVKSTCQKAAFVIENFLTIFKELNEKVPQELRKFLFSWFNQMITRKHEICSSHDGIFICLLDLCSLDDITIVINGEVTLPSKIHEHLISIITSRTNLPFEYVQVRRLLKLNNPSINKNIAELIKQNRVSHVDSDELFDILSKSKDFEMILNNAIHAEIIVSKNIVNSLKSIADPSIAVCLSRNLSSDLHNENIKSFIQETIRDRLKALKSLDRDDFDNCLKLFSQYPEYLSKEESESVLQYITTEYDHKYSSSIIEFIRERNIFDTPVMAKWVNKMTLYITRILSENNSLNEKFRLVVEEFKKLITTKNLWGIVNSNILNSQLEVILSSNWINDILVMEYTNLLLFSGSSQKLEVEKALQFLLNNEKSNLKKTSEENMMKFLNVSAIYSLIAMDPVSCCNQTVQQKLLSFYSGTSSSSDRMILNILQAIETKTSSSWTNLIYTWDFMESTEEDILDLVGETKLLIQEKEGFVLTLRKEFIEKTISNYLIDLPVVPTFQSSRNNLDNWNSLLEFNRKTNIIIDSKVVTQQYDPLFVILLSIHNRELVKVSKEEENAIKYVFDVKRFISSKIFQLTICALADKGETSQVAASILTQMMYGLEEGQQFKDSNIFKILLKKIIYTLNNESKEERVPSMIWFFVSRVSILLSQPYSSLYEKAYRWVLSNPSVRLDDIPLYSELTLQKTTEPNEYYYAQLSWVLTSLEQSIKTKEDVDLLKKRGVLEWLLNIMNVPYLNNRIRFTVGSILYQLQRIEQTGSLLITRFGSISNTELQRLDIDKHLKYQTERIDKNDKNSITQKRFLTLQQMQLNNDELLTGFIEITKSQKRLREWTGDDIDNIVKRSRI